MSTSFHTQTAKFLAVVGQSMPQVSGEQMQYWIENPAEVAAALASAFRSQPIQYMLDCSAPFDYLTFLGEGWKVLEMDKRANALSRLDISQVIFETCLNEGETSIKGETKLERLKAKPVIRLGGQQFLALWLDYKARGVDSVLEHLRKKGITYLDFFGLVLEGPGGDRCVPYLCWHDSGWDRGFSYLGLDWGAHDRSAVFPAS